MRRNISVWQFGGFIAASIMGVLLHFLYEWTGESVITAPFSGVNESTWEHMKLLFFPLFIFALIESRFFKDHENFWCIKLAGCVAGLLAMPILFYTYNGAFGKSPDRLNIMIFFISVAIAFLLENRLFKKASFSCKNPKIALALYCALGLLFVLFTFFTPKIPLFKDPLTGIYGI